MLGQGAYAIVREGVHKETGFHVAIKIYDKYKLDRAPQIKRGIQREINSLAIIARKYKEQKNKSEKVSKRKAESVSLGSNSWRELMHRDKNSNSLGQKGAVNPGHPSVMKLYDAIETPR